MTYLLSEFHTKRSVSGFREPGSLIQMESRHRYIHIGFLRHEYILIKTCSPVYMTTLILLKNISLDLTGGYNFRNAPTSAYRDQGEFTPLQSTCQMDVGRRIQVDSQD